MLTEENLDEAAGANHEDEEGDDENGLNKSQASILTGRPMSGKEARQQRFS